MTFLEDQEVPRQSKSARSILDEMPFDDDEVSQHKNHFTGLTNLFFKKP